tara:strand:+ start:1784 stop:1960 length:177 start_codon:yes stop_codon:yes gene_type:complete
MRTRAERRVRHVSQLKKVPRARRDTGDELNQSRNNGKAYQQIKVKGQKFFIPLNTKKE